MTLKDKYIMLKQKAKKAMINGQLNRYLQLILEVEQLSLVLVKSNNKR
ncbi:MAG: hypothetical protein HYU68_00320 [Bacteroidetes bacterium]|nr:hypothetical protein [Bacteroidota bacterium]